MWTQKKIPKPLLVYFVALFTYITAGSFISQGCSPPANACTPQQTNMLVEIPGKLQAASPDTDCIGWALVTNPIALTSLYGWRMRITVNDANGNPYSTRIYNAQATGTTTNNANAIMSDKQISIIVPSCGRFTTRIEVQRDFAGLCTGGSGANNTFMTWVAQSGTLELTQANPSISYLLGTQIANSYIDYAVLRPVI